MARDEYPMGEQATLATATWYRNREGTTVHRASCRHAAKGVPWGYAEGWTDERMAHAIGTLAYLHACRVCMPEWMQDA